MTKNTTDIKLTLTVINYQSTFRKLQRQGRKKSRTQHQKNQVNKMTFYMPQKIMAKQYNQQSAL